MYLTTSRAGPVTGLRSAAARLRHFYGRRTSLCTDLTAPSLRWRIANFLNGLHVDIAFLGLLAVLVAMLIGLLKVCDALGEHA
jgi:hypothetical protein